MKRFDFAGVARRLSTALGVVSPSASAGLGAYALQRDGGQP